MATKVNPVFAMLLCTVFLACGARCATREYMTIERALKSISNVVVKYKSEFDRRVKFHQLQEAIDAIDEAMLDYQGVAKNKLDQLRTLNSNARNTYQDCVGPVFEWCVSINSTFGIFISFISDARLTEHDRDIIWNMTINALRDGEKKTSNSLELLVLVQNKTAAVKNLLDSMLHDIHDDFGPQGYYGMQKAALKNAIAESQRARKILLIVGIIGLIFTAIVAFVTGPIGLSLALVTAFPPAIAAVVKGQHEATYEEQLQTIQIFLNILDERINKASEIANQINLDLAEDKNNLHELAGLISAAGRNKQLLLTDSPTVRPLLVPSFQKLGNTCHEYAMWHGYGSKGYAHHHARARRQANEACEVRRLEAMTAITRSMPQNTTFETMVSKAHSIIKEMDCESYTALPTPPQLLIDETSNESWRSSMITTYLKHVQ
ncbi:hypothetical protein TSAR_002029 [Trichomalopsis sarcophagae]|uniref:Uncharacterized protein n=1 Tax=Trichomalopsis sarcophagae TaxID=543379 RepID=A0A232FM55_9HYME|nr:hypothetical protein TSAR_002029 [Trichomalopsis sarcophagae]